MEAKLEADQLIFWSVSDVQCSGQRFALCDFDVWYFQRVREALFSRQSLRISASVTRITGTCFVNLRFCNQFLELVNTSFFTFFFFFFFACRSKF